MIAIEIVKKTFKCTGGHEKWGQIQIAAILSHSFPCPFFILGWDSNPIEWFSNPKTWFYSCLYSQQGHQINCGHCSLRLATFLSKFLYKFAGIIKTQGNPVVGAKYASNYFRRGTSMSFYPNFYLKFIQSFVKLWNQG